MIPGRVCDKVNCERYSERSGKLQGFEILRERNALPKLFETLFVDRLDPKKHVLQSNIAPKLENLLVSQQNVSSRLQVILFANPFARDHFADLHPVLRLNECHIV